MTLTGYLNLLKKLYISDHKGSIKTSILNIICIMPKPPKITDN